MAAIAQRWRDRVVSLADKFDMPGRTTFPAFSMAFQFGSPSSGEPDDQNAKIRLAHNT